MYKTNANWASPNSIYKPITHQDSDVSHKFTSVNDYDNFDIKTKSSMVFGNTRTKMLIQKSETLWDNVLRQKYLSDLEREKKNENIRKKQRMDTQDVIKKQMESVNNVRSQEKVQKAKDALEIKLNYD